MLQRERHAGGLRRRSRFAAWKIRFSGACLTIAPAFWGLPKAGEPTVRRRG